jgi:tetratricopeptide (TPR) repeat protein
VLPTTDLSLPERQQQALTLCFAGQFADALALLQPELDALQDANPDAEPDALAQTLNVAAIAALGLDRQDDALAWWRQCVEIKPDFVDAHHHLGLLLKARGRLAEAATAWRQALAISPHHFEALNHLGHILRTTGRLAEAERTYRLAVTLRPDHTGVRGSLGLVLAALKRFPEAERSYREVLEIQPDHAETHYRLGTALQAQNRMHDAANAYAEALRYQPDFMEAHNNLGCVLHALNQYEAAAGAFHRAIELRPDLAEAYHNFGSVMKELGRIPEAELAARAALALNPDYSDARFGLAVLLLASGRFEEGWRLYEARYERAGYVHHASGKMLKCPVWRGEPLAGRTLLVWQEDGLGDMLQFGRYLPLLKASGAARIEVACRGELHAIFAAHEAVDAVLDHSAALEKSDGFDCWTSLMSAPLHMGTTLETIPDGVWLKPEPALQARWRERLDTLPPGPRIGLVWKGNPKHHNDAHRSAPSLAMFARLWTVPGLNFVSLQKGQGEEEAKAPPANQPLLHLGSELQSFADTVAIVSQLDLVICVDTSTAHVAGALGKPCWVMLPGHDVDWRWLQGRDDSPWYPGTMRVFRQTPGGGWPALVGAVRKACAETFGAEGM